MGHELRLTICAATDDSFPDYFAEIAVECRGTTYTWAEVYLDNVDVSAEGSSRVRDARVVVRTWFGDDHFDVPHSDVIAALEGARARLLEAESQVRPE